MSKHDPYINKLIFSKYLIRKKIGKGSFGTVYQGINTSNNEKIALKVEKREKNDPGTLENEALRLVYLQGEGIPCVYCYGNNTIHNLLVEELLGKSLEDLFNSYGKTFSLKTVCVLGIEMIKRIQYIHSKHYIHRDIKPDNFMIGRGQNEKKIYIIDFGLAKKYYSVSKAQHIKFVTGKHLIGTARYCGRNAHRGYEQGRRDDIESIGYVLMYFLLGVLPWQGLKYKKNEDQFEKIAQKKYTTSFEELTSGQPEEFLNYFKHVEKLQFEDQPNYLYLIGQFQNVIDKYCTDCFYDFDWKKDSCTYVSRSTAIISRQADVSLIAHKNNDASDMNYSNINDEEENEENEKEEDNKEENGKENNGEHQNKKRRISRKEVFIGEDKTPIVVEEDQKDNENEKKKDKGKKDDNKSNGPKPRRSSSACNIIKVKERNINKKNNKKDKNKKNKTSKKIKQNKKENNFDNEDQKENNDSNKEENIDKKENNNNNISSCIAKEENQNSKQNLEKYEDNNIENKNEKEQPYYNDNYYLNNDYMNSINNRINYESNYNDRNQFQYEEKNGDYNDLYTKDINIGENNNNDDYTKNMDYELEEGTEKRKRNRSGSFDDKRPRDGNIICSKCIIF